MTFAISTVESEEGETVKDIDSLESGSRRSDDSRNVREGIIKEEERAVRRAKFFVGFAVMACAVAVFLAVFFLNKKSDLQSFEIEVRCTVYVANTHMPSSSMQFTRF